MKAPAVCIDERDDVAELHEQVIAARQEFQAAEEELDQLNRILDPIHDTADRLSSRSEVETLRAHQQLPSAKMRFMEAKAVLLELTPRYQRARIAAAVSLTASRNKARLPLLKKFAAAVDVARDIGEEIRAFDQETVRLGGSNPGHPFGQLLDEPPFREGDATRVRRLVEQLEK